MSRLYTLTAANEEPICNRCENQCSDRFCDECGPEHSWFYYRRCVEKEELSDEEFGRVVQSYGK